MGALGKGSDVCAGDSLQKIGGLRAG